MSSIHQKLNTSSKKEINKPILIGVTGGIGSGKSTIAKIFNQLGVPIFNSDVEAKKIVNTNKEVITAIKKLLGDVYLNNQLETSKVAKIVFNDKSALQELNNIVHPKVQETFKTWVMKNKSTPLLIKEAAILIETGAYKNLDQLILVIADQDVRRKRVMLRDNLTAKEVIKKMENQLSDNEKIPFADFIIHNNNNDMLIPQVLNVMDRLV